MPDAAAKRSHRLCLTDSRTAVASPGKVTSMERVDATAHSQVSGTHSALQVEALMAMLLDPSQLLCGLCCLSSPMSMVLPTNSLKASNLSCNCLWHAFLPQHMRMPKMNGVAGAPTVSPSGWVAQSPWRSTSPWVQDSCLLPQLGTHTHANQSFCHQPTCDRSSCFNPTQERCCHCRHFHCRCQQRQERVRRVTAISCCAPISNRSQHVLTEARLFWLAKVRISHTKKQLSFKSRDIS